MVAAIRIERGVTENSKIENVRAPSIRPGLIIDSAVSGAASKLARSGVIRRRPRRNASENISEFFLAAIGSAALRIEAGIEAIAKTAIIEMYNIPVDNSSLLDMSAYV
jgi:hypothetical protein